MLRLFLIVSLFTLGCCGKAIEKPQRVSEGDGVSVCVPGDEKIDIELYEPSGVTISPLELSFYCVGPTDECVGAQLVAITNHTANSVVIQKPVIEESEAFYFVQPPDYPVFLAPYEEHEVWIDFWWTRYQQFGILSVETSESTLECSLSGKWVNF